MARLIVVLGATGTQGGSVVARFLGDNSFAVRGITQNPASVRAKELAAQGVEIVGIDYGDEASILKAFEGAHTIYAVTDFTQLFLTEGAERAMEIEYTRGVNMAKTASKISGLEHYIWSTLPNSAKLSEGRWMVPHFDGKARVDDFIKQDKALLAKTVFFYPGWYPSNLKFPVLSPFYMKPANGYGVLVPVDPNGTPVASIGDPSVNIGIWIHAIITTQGLPTRPDGPAGLYVLGSVDTLGTITTFFQAWARAALKSQSPIHLLTITLQDFENIFGPMGTEVGLMLKFWEDVKERSWGTSGPGDVLISVKEIMDKCTSQAAEVGTEKAFAALDWDAVIRQD